MAGDGPHHIDAERDSRESELTELRRERDQLRAFADLVEAALERAERNDSDNLGCITYADEDAIRLAAKGLP